MFSRTLGGTNPRAPSARSIRHGRTSRSCLTASSTQAMRRCRLHGIDVDLAGTVGALVAADKHVLYSRNRTGAASALFPNNAHNLYAPFYAAYIPATSQARPRRRPASPGPIANNFPGFQERCRACTTSGICSASTAALANNACRDVGGDGQIDDPDVSRSRVASNRRPSTRTSMARRSCSSPGRRRVLTPNATASATSVRSAPPRCSARRRSRPRPDSVRAGAASCLSNTLTKKLFELAGKSLDCVAKSPIEAFCVEMIRDIRGNPVSGAEVSFTREPGGLMVPAALNFGGYNTIGQTVVSQTADEIRIRRTLWVRRASSSRARCRVSSTWMPRTSAPATAASASSASAASGSPVTA